MSVKNFFNGKVVSELFALARPVVSTEAKDKVINYLSEKYNPTWPKVATPPFDLAIDVGCGTGHSTSLFVPHFKRLIGIDVSSTQIEQAKKNYNFPHVTYKVGDATALPTENDSAQLVLCVQTAHWLDMEKFYAECDRILKRHGVLAILGYGLFQVHCKENPNLNGKINEAIENYYNFLADGNYWDKHRYIVDRQYVEFKLPYEDQQLIRNDSSIYLHRDMNVKTLMEYFATWSGYNEFCKQSPNNSLLNELEQM